jgi:ribosomal protein S30
MDVGSKVVHNQTIYDENGFGAKIEQEPDPKTGGIALVRVDLETKRPGYRPTLKRIPPPGMKGIVVSKTPISPEHRRYLPPRAQNQAEYHIAVKWAKGGVEHNYLDTELDPA